MVEPSPSALASLLRPFVAKVFRHVRRLSAERQAGQVSLTQPSSIMDDSLNETLDRLRGGGIDSDWWKGLLDRIGQRYIAPDFLITPALLEWLRDDSVANDLKTIAAWRIMETAEDEAALRDRLAQSYSNRTGEALYLAAGPIDVVVAILVAGYIAAIPPDQRATAGMVQAGFSRLDDRLDRFIRTISPAIDPITRQAHTERAAKELARILTLRAFDPATARADIQTLHDRLDTGNLSAADNEITYKVRYWLARLCAGDAETLGIAKRFRAQIKDSDRGSDLSIVDALICLTDGDPDGAIRIVRDRDDPDSRSTLFVLLVQSRNADTVLDMFQDEIRGSDAGFFTAFGWMNWACRMAEAGRWEEAAQHLVGFDGIWSSTPALAFFEGIINAQLLLPKGNRHLTSEPPLFVGITPNQGEQAESVHERAQTCFELARSGLNDLERSDIKRYVADWRLWLRLMNPRGNNVQSAHDEIRQNLESNSPDVNLMPFAFVFGVSFNPVPLRRYLSGQEKLGVLNKDELRAECLLFSRDLDSGEMSCRDFLLYLEAYQKRLNTAIPENLLISMRIDALVMDGQTERARALLAEAGSSLDKAEAIRLSAMIDSHDGVDPRKKLEQAYRETGNITDLGNLIRCLQQADDRESLLLLLKKMVELQRTVANATNLVVCLGGRPFFRHDHIIEFLEANSDLVERSPDLQSAKAWALFAIGRLSDARVLNESLRMTGQQAASMLDLDINIAVASGDWEHLLAIVDREWSRRNEHDTETLLALAWVAGHQSHSPNRALALIKLAADKAPNDPRVLSAAFELHFRLGRDEEVDPDWLMRAVRHSSAEDGPIWSVDLRTVVTEWMPKRQEQVAEIEQHWLAGKIPTGITASMLNVPLTRLLIQVPESNAKLIDRRMSAIIPMVFGGQPPVELQEDWAVGLDITSILVLRYLDLLDLVLDVFLRIKLAPGVMQCLFEEHARVRFHQPSQVKAGRQVRTLCNRQRLRVADDLGTPPEAVAAEVGRELGALLQAARQDDGKVVCVLPIYRPDSLLEKEADTSDWNDLIISAPDFCGLLHRKRGLIDVETHDRAQLFLRSQGQLENRCPEPSILDRTIYLDRLALSYLQDARVLEPIAAAGLDLRIHSNILAQTDELAAAGESSEELAAKIDGIRHVLRRAVESGRVSYLPAKVAPEDPGLALHGQFNATRSLLASAADCKALCIDDRFISREHFNVTAEKRDSTVPIACVLDILRCLVRDEHVTREHYWVARHKLRAGGFIFIPLEADELVHWLKAGSVENGRLVESAEARAIRQSLVRTHNLGLADTAEVSALQIEMPRTCMSIVRSLWNDESLPMASAAALSDWIWRHLVVAVLGDRNHIEKESYGDWIRAAMLRRVGLVLRPSFVDSQDRRVGYTDWVETSVVQPLQQANSDLVEEALTSLCDTIFDRGDEAEHYGHVFLKQLPEASRQYLLARYPERMERWGCMVRRIFTLGSGVSITDHDLFAAVKDVFSEMKAVSVQPTSGSEVTVALDVEDGNIVLECPGSDSNTRTMIPQLALLSPDSEKRTATLRSMLEQIGPAAPNFNHLLHDIGSREPEEHELSAVFHEASHGVAAVQDSLLRKFQFGLDTGAEDILPRDMAYFEMLVGPKPETRDTESYIRDVLIPWRTTLLDRDLKRGLDICCLGALRDDLCPGQWLRNFDDDVVWEALSTGDSDATPISLLGALDVALYRQHDERFLMYAERAVTKLCDDGFAQQEDIDIYRLLWTFMRFSFNRVNLVENGSRQPGFWKRMCAWMQAQFVARALLKAHATIDMDSLEGRSMSNMALVGAYAELVGAREEPMLLFMERLPPGDLRCEVLGRLVALRARHAGEGRSIPLSEEIDRALERARERGNWLKCFFHGPLEGHRRPVAPPPEDLTKFLRETEADVAVPESWHLIACASHLHALGDPELTTARGVVTKVPHPADDMEMQNHLLAYELASIVAKTNRDTLLADAIADAVTRICRRVSNENHIYMIISICLQAAAAFEEHGAWFDWLEDRLASIASCLPGPPNKAVRIFLEHLDAMETILPIDSWFHRRARSIAAAGAELRP